MLEIGSGFTTPFLLSALHGTNTSKTRVLVTVDDMSHSEHSTVHTNIRAVRKSLETAAKIPADAFQMYGKGWTGINHEVRSPESAVGRALRKYASEGQRWSGFGMIWDDATSGHSLNQQHALWPLLRGDGTGIFLRHWTNIMWEPHETSPENEFVELTEPHKTHQCQVGIRRKLPVPGAPKPPSFPGVGQAEVAAVVRAVVRFVRPRHSVYGEGSPAWMVEMLQGAVAQNKKDAEWERELLLRPPMSAGSLAGRGDLWHHFHRLKRDYYREPHAPTVAVASKRSPITPEFGTISTEGKSISAVGREIGLLWAAMSAPGTIALHASCRTPNRKCRAQQEDATCSATEEASCAEGSVSAWVKVPIPPVCL